MSEKYRDIGSMGSSALIAELAGVAGYESYLDRQKRLIAAREPLSLRVNAVLVGEALTWDGCWQHIDAAFQAMEPYNNQKARIQVVMRGADGSLLGRTVVAALWEACCEDPWLFHLHFADRWVGTGSHSSTDRA